MPRPTNPDEEFVQLLAHHEPTIRAYVRIGLTRASDVDEVMQEVSLVAWKKFSQLDDPEGFPRWVCVIARYELLKFRRNMARDRLVLDEDVLKTITAEALDETAISKKRLEFLEACLSKLSGRRRRIVLQAYRPECQIKDLALEMGTSADALYQLLSRIRSELSRCVEYRLAAEELGS